MRSQNGEQNSGNDGLVVTESCRARVVSSHCRRRSTPPAPETVIRYDIWVVMEITARWVRGHWSEDNESIVRGISGRVIAATTHTYSSSSVLCSSRCACRSGIYASMFSCTGTSAFLSISPFPCPAAHQSLFMLRRGVPTHALPGLSFTAPPRIPLVCGIPSTTAVAARTVQRECHGSRFACFSCAPERRAIKTEPKSPQIHVFFMFSFLSSQSLAAEKSGM